MQFQVLPRTSSSGKGRQSLSVNKLTAVPLSLKYFVEKLKDFKTLKSCKTTRNEKTEAKEKNPAKNLDIVL